MLPLESPNLSRWPQLPGPQEWVQISLGKGSRGGGELSPGPHSIFTDNTGEAGREKNAKLATTSCDPPDLGKQRWFPA